MNHVPDSHRVPHTRLVVDYFRPPRPANASAFLLTHYHSDHYGGLTPQWGEERRIYASELTARLLVNHLGVSACAIHTLVLNERTRLAHDEPEAEVYVTALDANHCPGSVLFLLEISWGPPAGGRRRSLRCLHCGDMRYHPRMRSYAPLLPSCSQSAAPLPIDALFLDTTYCHPKYRFPTQAEAIGRLVDVAAEEVASAAAAGERTLVLVATYLIGKERALCALAQRLRCRLLVSAYKMSVLRLLRLPQLDVDEVFTEDACESHVHVTAWEAFTESVPWGFKPHWEKLLELLRVENIRRAGGGGGGGGGGAAAAASPYFTRVVGFVPTGWTWNFRDGSVTAMRRDNASIYGVPYSEHSSYDELREWVAFLRPARVVPTVGGSTDAKRRALVAHFRDLVDDRAAKAGFMRRFEGGGAASAAAAPDSCPADLALAERTADGPAEGGERPRAEPPVAMTAAEKEEKAEDGRSGDGAGAATVRLPQRRDNPQTTAPAKAAESEDEGSGDGAVAPTASPAQKSTLPATTPPPAKRARVAGAPSAKISSATAAHGAALRSSRSFTQSSIAAFVMGGGRRPPPL